MRKVAVMNNHTVLYPAYLVFALATAGCTLNSNLWKTICADQLAYSQQIPNPFLDPAQGQLALHTLCGTVAPSPAASPTPGK